MDYNQIYDILTLYERYKGSLNDDGIKLDFEEITEKIRASLPSSKIYIVTGSFDYLDDYHKIVYGAYSNKDVALEKAHEIAKHYNIIESELPMSFKEFSKCNYGFRNEEDIPDDFNQWSEERQMRWHNEIVDRNGHTKEEFNKMQDAFEIKYKHFNFCMIDTYIVNEEKTEETIYVYPDGREQIIEEDSE